MKTLVKLVLLFFSISGIAQFATDHYIAPSPWQYWSNANEIVLATEEVNAVQFTISKSDGTALYSATVSKNNPISYRFSGTPTIARNDLDVTTTDRGLIINAAAPVTVNLRNIASDSPGTNGSNIKGNASLFSFGDEGIGTEFRLGYYRSDYVGIATGAPIYSVMALQDNTIINLNGVFLTELNKGESRLFKANIGALLSTDKPVVANVGAYLDAPQGLCGDGTVDQIAPVRSLGTQYVVIRGAGKAGTDTGLPEQSTIVASQNNTTVTIINYNAAGVEISRSNKVLANAGDYKTIHHGDATSSRSSSYISADKPVAVYSGTAVGCETDISTVVPIGGCSGLNSVVTKKFINYRNRNLSYFGSIILESATEDVLINGNNIETLTGANRTAIGNTGFYLLHFTNGQLGNPNNIYISSNAKLTTTIVQQGGGFSMSAFFSAFNDSPETPVVIATDACSKTLQTESGLNSYQWYLNGVLIPGATQNTFVATQTGNYTVIGERACGLTNASAPLYITIAPCINDLEIKKEVIAVQDDEATFRLTVTNIGNTDDTRVQVGDVLPSGYTFISADVSKGTFVIPTSTWSVGDLNSGASETLEMRVKINNSGDFVNKANVRGRNRDDNPANNIAEASVTRAALLFTKAGLDALPDFYEYPGIIGYVINYNLVLTNTGTVTISNIVVRDDNADVGSVNPSTILSLAPGEKVDIKASHTVTASDIALGFYSNQAIASGVDSLGNELNIVSDDPATAALADPTVAFFVPNDPNPIVPCVPPVLKVPPPILLCTNNLAATFVNLQNRNNTIVDQPNLYSFAYYLNQNDLDNGIEIQNPSFYRLNNTKRHKIIVAVTENATGCRATVTLEIIANTSPDSKLLVEDTLCKRSDNLYNLRQYDAEILNNDPNPNSVIVNYYLTYDDARDNIKPIPDAANRIINSDKATFYIRLENETDCHTVSTLELTIVQPAVINLDEEYLVCLQDNVFPPTEIQATIAIPNVKMEWYKNGVLLPNETKSSLIAFELGIYTIQVTNAAGCIAEATTTVRTNDMAPKIEATIKIEEQFKKNVSITVIPKIEGEYLYALDQNGEQESNVFYNVTPGYHIVSIRDTKKPCAGTLIRINILDYPKFFTPNGDGQNDTWNIWSLSNQPNALISIFDRYGKLLKTISPSGEGWDGTYNGKNVPAADYWFHVTYKEINMFEDFIMEKGDERVQKEFRSHFTLKR